MVLKMRTFNRFYTNLLGLLDRHLLETEFSLTEARILFELGETDACSATDLTEKLNIDPGYLSRILKRFEKKGLAARVRSNEDGRLYPIHLTESGRETLLKMNERSDRQSQALIETLSPSQQAELTGSMDQIQRYLSGAKNPAVTIRHDLRPGDAGALIQMHGWIYEKEYGYNHVFEGYVCKTFFDFLTTYDPAKDRIWFAESGGKMVGAIAVVGHPDGVAQMRWFLLHPDFRGQGIGRRLMEEALAFAKACGCRKVFLITTDNQTTAVRMYEKAGFQKTSETPSDAWGVHLMEQVFELSLDTSKP
jgi:DNA-binding MarR family transcriptional regulator/N-acetylglutamate synthase-like GNAT family acetyltransferase